MYAYTHTYIHTHIHIHIHIHKYINYLLVNNFVLGWYQCHPNGIRSTCTAMSSSGLAFIDTLFKISAGINFETMYLVWNIVMYYNL